MGLEEFDAQLGTRGVRRMDLTDVMENVNGWDTLFKFLQVEHNEVLFHFGVTETNQEMFQKLGELASFTSGQFKSFMKCGQCIIYQKWFVVGYKRGDGKTKEVYLNIIRDYA